MIGLQEDLEPKFFGEIGDLVKASLSQVEKIATTSGHLKGTYIKFLQDSVKNVEAAVFELARRTSAVSTESRLAEENLRLKRKVISLTQDVKDL